MAIRERETNVSVYEEAPGFCLGPRDGNTSSAPTQSYSVLVNTGFNLHRPTSASTVSSASAEGRKLKLKAKLECCSSSFSFEC